MSDSLDHVRAALAGRYTVERELGAGGMATVYLAQDPRHDRRVAVKVLRSDLSAALGADRFVREIKIAANLHHPHILPLYDSGEADGLLFYVMPYVDGESLRDRLIREGELPVAETVRILSNVVDALSKAHSLGLVHRDIKPDNVMLAGRHAVVMDFGVAKAVSDAREGSNLTSAGVALGTPAYMAPEQAAGDPHIDHRADIYAVGALAYEMLTGRPPFTGTTQQEVLAKQVTATPEAVTVHRPSVSRGLETLVMRCLEKKAADRWQTADEILPHLEALATPSGGMQPTAAMAALKRKPTMAWGAVGAGVLVVGLVGWAIGGSRSGGSAPESIAIAVLPCENRSSNAEDEYFSDGFAQDLNAQLQKSGGFSVIAHGSARFAHESEATYADQAVALHVTHLVDCSVRRDAGRVHVNASLIDPPTSRQLWTDVYERGDSIVAIAAIKTDIVRRLAATLHMSDSAATEPLPTENMEAYNAFLLGRFHSEKGVARADFRQAVTYFSRAITADSGFALAHVGLATAHMMIATVTDEGPPTNPIPIYGQAQSAAEQALRLDPSLGEAHAALGAIRLFRDMDLDAADRATRRAVDLSPHSADVHNWRATYLATVGRSEEAIAEMAVALEINPLSPWLNSFLGLFYGWGGRLDDAVRQFQHTLALDSTYRLAISGLAEAYFARGEYDEALAQTDKLPPLGIWVFTRIAILHHMGRQADALTIRDQMTASIAFFGRDAPLAQAALGLVEFGVGNSEETFRLFRQATEGGYVTWIALSRTPLTRSLWDDPRFRELINIAGIDLDDRGRFIPLRTSTRQ
jgi:eukaryotic-like serine/threonine-protein kinase